MFQFCFSVDSVNDTGTLGVQDQLLAEGVSLAVNVKGSVLDRLARCTETEVATNLDSLSRQNSLLCGSFHLEEVQPRSPPCVTPGSPGNAFN